MKDQQVSMEDISRRKDMLERDTLTLGTSLRPHDHPVRQDQRAEQRTAG
jgi:hypothetical protein